MLHRQDKPVTKQGNKITQDRERSLGRVLREAENKLCISAFSLSSYSLLFQFRLTYSSGFLHKILHSEVKIQTTDTKVL